MDAPWLELTLGGVVTWCKPSTPSTSTSTTTPLLHPGLHMAITSSTPMTHLRPSPPCLGLGLGLTFYSYNSTFVLFSLLSLLFLFIIIALPFPYDRYSSFMHFYRCSLWQVRFLWLSDFFSLILEVSPKQLFCFSLLNIMTWMTENFVIILQSFEHSK